MKRRFVVDASSALKLLVEEPGTEEARRFFGRLEEAEPIGLFVPDLFYVECANALWKYVFRHGYSAQSAKAALETLGHLALESVATRELYLEALSLSLKFHISAYDGCYLALAQKLRCGLVTEDLSLIKLVKAHVQIPLFCLSEANLIK